MAAQLSSEEPSASILVVDDNAGSRLATRAMLEPLGHPIVEAGSGRDALRAVSARSFALILMDVRMPTMDGYQTAKLIRERRHSERTPIVFVSAFERDEKRTAAAYASGGVDFVFKPILPEVLRAKVSALVALFMQAHELQRSVESITALNVALRDSEVRARTVLENVADGIVTAGEGGLIESFNRSACRLFGYREDEAVGRPLEQLVAASRRDELAGAARARWERLGDEDVPSEAIETLGCRMDGSCFAVEMNMSRMQVGDGALLILCIRDISGRQAYTEALRHRALHDTVTGLPNGALFADRIDQSIATAERSAESRGVLVLDLDGFRAVNDSYGRQVGDALLHAVAERLRGTVRDADTVARLEGDAFGVLPAGDADIEGLAAAAWKLRAALERPFDVAGHRIDTQASIGIAVYPQHGRGTADLVRRAELAVAEAKASSGGLATFVSDPEDRTERRLALLTELRDGIPRGELVLHFQPKVELQSLRTVGVEALVRWQHPVHGLLMPGDFIPDADRSDLIEPLTSWVLDAALRQQGAWNTRGLDLTMAVNISARSFTRGSDLPRTVARLTETWGISPGMLILELTESALVNADAPDVFDRLHAMGERLAIDDFGTGHSSLVYLQRLPIDEVKVDRSFVMNLATDASDAVIARSTIDLAHNLGLSVVAEGVEDSSALELLIEYGCDCAQGYLFSRPLPADELTEWLSCSPYGSSLPVQ